MNRKIKKLIKSGGACGMIKWTVKIDVKRTETVGGEIVARNGG